MPKIDPTDTIFDAETALSASVPPIFQKMPDGYFALFLKTHKTKPL